MVELDLVFDAPHCIKKCILSTTASDYKVLKNHIHNRASNILNEIWQCPSKVQWVKSAFNSLDFAGGDCWVFFKSLKPQSLHETQPIWPWL